MSEVGLILYVRLHFRTYIYYNNICQVICPVYKINKILPMTDPWCCYIWCAIDPINIPHMLAATVRSDLFGTKHALLLNPEIKGNDKRRQAVEHTKP